MTTRRSFIAASALAASTLASLEALAHARQETKGARLPIRAERQLFVQNAKGMIFAKATNKQTLTGVSPRLMFQAGDLP
jgi:hypothetical protein